MAQKVLIVEDNNDDADLMIQSLLETVPALTVVRVSTLPEAVEYIRKNVPSIISTDVEYSDMNGIKVRDAGLQFAAIVREDPRLAGVPLIVHSDQDEAALRGSLPPDVHIVRKSAGGLFDEWVATMLDLLI